MNAKETLAKYGLASDVKSIKGRITQNTYSYVAEAKVDYLNCESLREYCHLKEQLENELRTADLDLLCEMAEKVEKIAEVVADETISERVMADRYKEIKRILDGTK